MTSKRVSPATNQPTSFAVNRRDFIGAVGVGAAVVGVSTATRPTPAVAATGSAPSNSPNVIYVFSDTHRWSAMSFTQTPQAVTPHMAAMRDAGVSMDNCYSTLPICTPYRAILQSGRWPWQTGLMANHMELAQRVDRSQNETTRGALGHMFRDAGYRTGYVGKWHLGGRDARSFGYDVSYIWGGEDHSVMAYSKDGGPLKQWTPADGYSGVPARPPFPAMPDHKYKIIGETDHGLRFIDRAHKDPDGRPFFLMLSLQDPHGAFEHQPPHTLAHYPDEKALPLRPNDRQRNWESHRDYHACVSAVDDELGRILAKVDELGIADNTIVVYTSDHGGMSGAQGIGYGQKRMPHEESAHVPFLLQWRGGVPGGRDVNAMFSTIDIFPTLCHLAGLPAGLEKASQAGGESAERSRQSLEYLRACPGVDHAKNVLGQPGGPDPDSVFVSHPSNMNNKHGFVQVSRAVVTKDHMYAVKPDGEWCLYDRQADPYQMKDLIDAPEHAPTRQRLWRRLNEWMDVAERPFLDKWFAASPEKSIKAWNKEHKLGANSADRKVGRQGVFDLSESKPG